MQTWGYNEGKSKAAENTNKDRNVRVAVKKTPEARDAKQDQNNRQDNEARMVDGRDPGKSWNNRSSSKWNNRTKPSDGGNKGVNLQKDRLSGETGRGKINQNNKNQDRLNMDNNTVKNREP
ncbi:MAG: hypothetical protein PHG48_00670, partial [Eubacteriales bacterium]|nr:hypothetical protein [Eubacteriales bacterium]